MAAGRTITPDMLKPADIIVSTTSAAASVVIRGGTFSKVSHSRLYLDGGELIEAVSEGVVLRTVDESIAADTLTIVLRHNNIADSTAQAIMRDASREIGKKYDYTGAANAAPAITKGFVCWVSPLLSLVFAHGEVANVIDQDAKFFCSELVARLFEKSNLKIVNGPAYKVNPKQLHISTSLSYVGNLRGGEM